MLHFPNPVPTNMIRKPQRSDSLQAGASIQENALLAKLPDELHDMRRVQAYGQEEDLKEALGKMIGRVDELSKMLNAAHKTQTELETSLKLARSNMQLALANNEMLEDALRRESAIGSKDVGWRRRSDRPESRQGHHAQEPSEGNASRPSSRRGSASASVSAHSTPTSEAMASPSTPNSPVIKPTSPPPPPVAQDSRFFRFRFGSSSASSSPNPNAGPSSRPRTPPASAGANSGARRQVDALRDASHLTSASLPSLVASTSKREEELVIELAAERAKYTKVSQEKSTLEQEVEGLSQALFEEANKMVAQERIKCAEIEEELRQVRQEKEALKSAMRVIEQENTRLKSPVTSSIASLPNLALMSPALIEDDPTPRGSRPTSRTRRRSQSGSVSSRGLSSRSNSVDASRITRARSTSSTRGFRQKSSSSERGWTSSPSHASVPLPDSDTSSSTSEKDLGRDRGPSMTRNEGKEKEEVKNEAAPTLPPMSPSLADMPFEESPWGR